MWQQIFARLRNQSLPIFHPPLTCAHRTLLQHPYSRKSDCSPSHDGRGTIEIEKKSLHTMIFLGATYKFMSNEVVKWEIHRTHGNWACARTPLRRSTSSISLNPLRSMMTMQAVLPPNLGSSPFPAMPTRPSGFRSVVSDLAGEEEAVVIVMESIGRMRQETRFVSNMLGEVAPTVICQAGIRQLLGCHWIGEYSGNGSYSTGRPKVPVSYTQGEEWSIDEIV